MSSPGSRAPGGLSERSRKPMYEDTHETCSCLLAKIRNEQHLLALPPADQFRWLHRFYLVLDRIAEHHRVYKLYGGPHGFMVSTGVAEPDPNHAATLLRFALHLLQAAENISLSGGVPLELGMVLASGPATSGLLGSTSLTYQMVGRSVSVAREVLESQPEPPFLVTSGMREALSSAVVGELVELGAVELRCCPGEREPLYTLPRFAGLRLAARPPEAPLIAPAHAPAGAPAEATRASAEAATLPHAKLHADEFATYGADGALPAGIEQPTPAAEQPLAAPDSPLPPQPPASGGDQPRGSRRPTHDMLEEQPDADLLLRFEDQAMEGDFARFQGDMQCAGEVAWLLLGLCLAAVYTRPLSSALGVSLRWVVALHVLPAAVAALSFADRPAYLRLREGAWCAQRLLVLLAFALPRHACEQPAVLFALGAAHLLLEVVARRVRLHLQLLSSLALHCATLACIAARPDGLAARALATPASLALHLLATVVVPVLVTLGCDRVARRAFWRERQVRALRWAADGDAGRKRKVA